MMTHHWSAACLGCFGYFIALGLTGAFAGLAGMGAPFYVVGLTVLTMAACFFVGLFLLAPSVRRLWDGGRGLPTLMLCVGVALYLFGLWSIEQPPPASESHADRLLWPSQEVPWRDPDELPLPARGATTFPGLALTVFAVAHWPLRRRQPNPALERTPTAVPSPE